MGEQVPASKDILFASGTLGSVKLAKDQFNKVFHNAGNGIIKRECADRAASHKTVYFVRKTAPASFDAYTYMLVTWKDHNNVLNKDFSIHSSLEDAKAGTNAWQFCNYNLGGIGFPRDCGPTGNVAHQWTSFNHGHGRKNVRYSVVFDGTIVVDTDLLTDASTFLGEEVLRSHCSSAWNNDTCRNDNAIYPGTAVVCTHDPQATGSYPCYYTHQASCTSNTVGGKELWQYSYQEDYTYDDDAYAVQGVMRDPVLSAAFQGTWHMNAGATCSEPARDLFPEEDRYSLSLSIDGACLPSAGSGSSTCTFEWIYHTTRTPPLTRHISECTTTFPF